MRRIVNILTLAATAVVTWLLLTFLLQRQVLFPAPAGIPTAVPSADDGIEVISLPLSDGAAEAWFLPPLGSPANPAPVMLVAHGNAEIIDYLPALFDAPREWGIGVLLVEYPGYGRSSGSPSEQSIVAAMVAAYDHLLERQDIDPQRIVVYGRSLGGGAATALAERRPLAAMILQSTFRSVRYMARRMFVPGFLVRDPFDNLSALQRFDRPVLIVHGELDTIIPIDHAHALHAAAPRSELRVMPCGHNDCHLPWPAVQIFLRKAGVLRGSEPQ